MCLLAVLFRVRADAPLVVAANRDELLARPAVSMGVLRDGGDGDGGGPRILGGRDLVAGGTWLAVNEHGVFAGLTNRPTLVRDPSKRSRGELPLALAQHTSARAAVASFAQAFRPADYSPAWIFAGDRDALFLVDMTAHDAGPDARPTVVELGPGVHILENRAYGASSAKVARVRASLESVERAPPAVPAAELLPRLVDVLRDHVIPDGDDDSGVAGFVRPRETEAACVHAGPYGTRSGAVVLVPARAGADARPRVWASDGPPCTHELVERTALWSR